MVDLEANTRIEWCRLVWVRQPEGSFPKECPLGYDAAPKMAEEK
jgi:hypothetical protein